MGMGFIPMIGSANTARFGGRSNGRQSRRTARPTKQRRCAPRSGMAPAPADPRSGACWGIHAVRKDARKLTQPERHESCDVLRMHEIGRELDNVGEAGVLRF